MILTPRPCLPGAIATTQYILKVLQLPHPKPKGSCNIMRSPRGVLTTSIFDRNSAVRVPSQAGPRYSKSLRCLVLWQVTQLFLVEPCDTLRAWVHGQHTPDLVLDSSFTMQPFRVPKPEPQEVDVIVAGGGPAGCVVAGRLAKADPNLQVMLIEYGPNNIDDPMVSTPAVYPRNMRLLESDKAHFYYDTNKSSHLRGRKTIVPCAKADIDDFKTEGWNYQDLLPLMKRLENYQKPCNNDTHGFDGPVAISNGGWVAPIAQDFLRASTAVGIPLTDDLQDCQQSHAAEIWAKWINKDTGRRSDAASAYVHPIMAEQSNLHLRCNSKVARVIFEGNKAVGVAYVNSRQVSAPYPTVETIVKARKMVVLTSGTLSTPQILERSGIGGKDILDKAGVKTLVDLPGVGKQYQDHYTTFSVFRARASEPTADDWLRGDPKVQEEWMRLHAATGKGPAASNGIDAGFKIRPTEEELKEMGVCGHGFSRSLTMECRINPINQSCSPVLSTGSSAIILSVSRHGLWPVFLNVPISRCVRKTVGRRASYSQSFIEYPFSRGSIHISSSDPYADPIFDSGFLNHEADVAPIRWSYKKVREVARRMDAYRGELTSLHPHFHPDSPAACEDVDLQTAKEYMPAGQLTVGIHMGTWSKPRKPLAPGERRIVDEIKYSKEDDEAIDNWVRDHVETTWHSLGTCAMKPRDQEGVLDPRLIALATVLLQRTSLIDPTRCGEKCAELIAEETQVYADPKAAAHIPIMRRASTKQQQVQSTQASGQQI
ncbi:alcohol oxidase [Rhizoctonia solani AG-1 IA]|uniref:Alcohol oxidase n=1 Tax=Thanatephorus cucumeris (strain AG1-IA) TaxID=983506 RepID=L8WJL6_THACA|nr:alcohol oxidase [Rhizoctonia solani AG-1 IA]